MGCHMPLLSYAGLSSRPASVVRESCELRTDGKLRASFKEAQSCLEMPSCVRKDLNRLFRVRMPGIVGSAAILPERL